MYYFAIFRIKLGDYLGDYFTFAYKISSAMVVAYKHNISVGLGNQYKNGSCCVRIRVTYSGNRIDLHTKLSATSTEWDAKRQRYKQGCCINGTPYNILNSTIDSYINYIHDYFNKASLREVIPTLKELKEQFNYAFKQSAHQADEFFFIFQKYIDERSVTRQWSKEYKDMFTRVLKSLKTFKVDIRFTDFSNEIMNSYINYLAQTMYNDKIDKVLSMLKEFLKYANQKNFPVNKEFFGFDPNLPKSQKAIRYLTVDELQCIINLPLEKGSALDMTRDFFVFQCYTALRYSDLKQLKHDNIREISEGKYEIDILTEKDNDRISFPLSKVATDIYLKYKNNLYDNDVVFAVISNQKYNEHLKELGSLAEIEGDWIDYHFRLDKKEMVRTPKKNLTSHTARRTFVVTALNEGIELDLIRQITSHSDVEAIRPYIASTMHGKQKVIDALDKATESIKNW